MGWLVQVPIRTIWPCTLFRARLPCDLLQKRENLRDLDVDGWPRPSSRPSRGPDPFWENSSTKDTEKKSEHQRHSGRHRNYRKSNKYQLVIRRVNLNLPGKRIRTLRNSNLPRRATSGPGRRRKLSTRLEGNPERSPRAVRLCAVLYDDTESVSSVAVTDFLAIFIESSRFSESMNIWTEPRRSAIASAGGMTTNQ